VHDLCPQVVFTDSCRVSQCVIQGEDQGDVESDYCFLLRPHKGATREAQGWTVLQRDFATITFSDIDVPFRSLYLWTGALSCACEHQSPSIVSHDLTLLIDLLKINSTRFNPNMLIGQYIPNLITQPFDISREYIDIIYDQTQSPRLEKVLKKWDEDDWGNSRNRQKLAYIILAQLLA